MEKLLYLAFFLSFVSFSYQQACPGLFTNKPNPRHFLNLDKFSGQWNLLYAGPPEALQPNLACVHYNFQRSLMSRHFLDVQYFERNNGIPVNLTGLATIKLVNFPLPSEWDVWFYDSYMPTDIVATDLEHEDYMIMHTCNDFTGLRPATVVWLVFSRSTSLNPTLQEAIFDFIEGFGHAKTRFTPINQIGC